MEGRAAALNLQPWGSKAKANQVRKVRRIIIENVEVIIDEWIETAIEKDWPIPEPKGSRLVFA